jgi:plasmid stabilization system protein ParE
MKLIGAWWRKNRQAAPTLFDDELDDAIDRIARQPLIGAFHEVIGGKTFRRILLRRTKQNVFYVIDDAKGVVVIHTIWGARRGRKPKL